MEESLKGLTHRFEPMPPEEAAARSPLTLAFLGDSAYELLIRSRLVARENGRPKDLSREKSAYVKASAQSRMMEAIAPCLTDEEEQVYRRGRNAKAYSVAKNASVGDYRRATGFEALMGYLYLSGQTGRMEELADAGIAYIEDVWRGSGASLIRRSRN